MPVDLEEIRRGPDARAGGCRGLGAVLVKVEGGRVLEEADVEGFGAGYTVKVGRGGLEDDLQECF